MFDMHMKHVMRFEKVDDPSLFKAISRRGGRFPSPETQATAVFEFMEKPDSDFVERVKTTLGEGWMMVANEEVPATMLPMRRIERQEALKLLEAAERRLSKAGIKGAHHALMAPAGWATIVEAFSVMAADIAARAPKGAVLRIDQIKEKFGEMRVYTGATGLPEDLAEEYSRLEAWSEMQSYGRCLLLGLPGQAGQAGHWMVTISEDALAHYEEDPSRFHREVYVGHQDMVDD